MAGATCDERLVRLLLDRGADPRRGNAHGWTPLHQAAYSDLPVHGADAARRRRTGRRLARGDGGTPLVIALFWGIRVAAELLEPDGLPSGQPARCGRPRATSTSSPSWAPTDARPGRPRVSTGRTAAFRRGNLPTTRRRFSTRLSPGPRALIASRRSTPLVARGADLDGDVYRGTAARVGGRVGHVRAVRRLSRPVPTRAADHVRRPRARRGRRRRSTSPPRTATLTRSRAARRSAPTRPRATRSTTAPLRAGRTTAARPPPVTC